jgi:hypothetical protein
MSQDWEMQERSKTNNAITVHINYSCRPDLYRMFSPSTNLYKQNKLDIHSMLKLLCTLYNTQYDYKYLGHVDR